eukprot:4955467-Prymnesium_polylepis.1
MCVTGRRAGRVCAIQHGTTDTQAADFISHDTIHTSRSGRISHVRVRREARVCVFTPHGTYQLIRA